MLDLNDLEQEMASLGRAHDRSWDLLTAEGGRPSAKHDPEARYHFEAAMALEELFNRGRQLTQVERILKAAGR